MNTNSSLFNLNLKDLGKGVLLAVITAFVASIYQTLSATPVHLPTVPELKADGMIALAAGISYLLKNFLSNNEGQPLKADVK